MTNLHHPCIGFVGAGNMASCLISGLIASGYPPKQIWVSNPTMEKLHLLQQQYGINISTSNHAAAEKAEIVVLSVKPQQLKAVATELKKMVEAHSPLLISLSPGITVSTISRWLVHETAIVRAMPNVPAFVSSGATGLYANPFVTTVQRDWTENIFRAIGITVWAKEEKLMDVIAALSGSGPAYFFYVMEILTRAAVSLGLEAEDAQLLTLQTALGSAKLALSTNESLEELRARVTSKGGITERALAALKVGNIEGAFEACVNAARDRSIELGKVE
jgi:pyrroline-5-carboxylate reductase